MNPHSYPGPDLTPNAFSKDKTWGLVVVVLSSVGLCLGSITLLIGGAVGLVGSAAVIQSGGPDAKPAAVAAGGFGALIAIVGGALILSALVQVVGGFGIMKSRRWGFVLTGVLAVLSFALGLASLPQGIVHMAINAVIAWYCWSRMSGKDGPVPL